MVLPFKRACASSALALVPAVAPKSPAKELKPFDESMELIAPLDEEPVLTST